MGKGKTPDIKYVTQNKVFIVAIVCLIVGFLGGVIYSTFKSGSEGMSGQALYQTPASQQVGISPQQSDMILTLEKRLSENPGDQESWVQLGNLYFDADLPQKAINAYSKYNELNPYNPDVWTDLGIMYRRTGQFSLSIAAFDKAMEINPKHPQSRFNKGIVLLHDLNNPEAALRSWEVLIEIAPNFKGPGGQPIQQLVENIKKSLEPRNP